MIKTVQEVLAQQRSNSTNYTSVNLSTQSSFQSNGTLNKAKILVLGNIEVGKTGELYLQKMPFENDIVSMEIQDTSSEMNEDVLEKYITWADGCVCIYSVLDESSFRHVDTLYLLVRKVKTSSGETLTCFPMVAVANKIDAVDDTGRAVSEHEGKRMSRRVRCPVFECSVANNNCQVVSAMDNLLSQIRSCQLLSPPTCTEKRTLKGVTLRVLRKKIYRNRSDTV